MTTDQQIVSDAHAKIFAALSAASTIEIDYPTPEESSSWTLASDALRFIAALVATLSPEHVLELGAGVSTRILAAACSKLPHPTWISSIDHDPEYGQAALPAALAAAGAQCHVRVQIAPLVARLVGQRFVPLYSIDRAQLAGDRPTDLVIIDGPPNALGGRSGMLFQAMEFVHPGSIVLLDDAARQEEREAVQIWESAFGDAVEVVSLPGFVKGLVAIIIREVVAPEEVPSYWSRRYRAELERIMETGVRCVLIDDGQLYDTWLKERDFLPFMEHNGEFWGAPATDADAIAELDRRRAEGVAYLAILKPAFWWLDHYVGFADHLRRRCRVVERSESMILYDLRSDSFDSSAG